MKERLFYMLICLVCIVESCDYLDTRLKVINHSSHSVIVAFSIDTVFGDKSNSIGYDLDYKINQFDTLAVGLPGSKKEWNKFAYNSVNSELHVYFIPSDTLMHQDWNYIRERELYERYDFTLEELKKQNWIITYH
jgi:hypothetical protein